MQGANPYVRTHDAVRDWIAAASIAPAARVHMFALGKAAATMAAGAAQALADQEIRIAGGVVVVATLPGADATHEQGGQLPPVLELRVGDHPVPDIGSLAAADVIARKVHDVQKGDIALVLISGGTTSLCAAPCDELLEMYGHPMNAQAMLKNLVSALHHRGLAIHEMNAIRRRLLRWGGGRLAVALANQGASHIRVFSVSDVIGDDPSVIGSGPCSPDPMSEAEFLAMLDAYNLRDVPAELGVALGLQGGPDEAVLPPHPGDHSFSLVDYTIVARNIDACNALANHARKLGIADVLVVTTPLTGEAETLGHTIASIALRAASTSDHEQLIVWGGEPTVSMDLSARNVFDEPGDTGDDEIDYAGERNTWSLINTFRAQPEHQLAPMGGRMQALALAAALALEGLVVEYRKTDALRVTILAAGTDGRDGPTDACGAIVDVLTPLTARERGRDPVKDLTWLRSYHSLDAAAALLKTGPTGTNVMDVVVVYVAAAQSRE